MILRPAASFLMSMRSAGPMSSSALGRAIAAAIAAVSSYCSSTGTGQPCIGPRQARHAIRSNPPTFQPDTIPPEVTWSKISAGHG
jgi:hypothetical protein